VVGHVREKKKGHQRVLSLIAVSQRKEEKKKGGAKMTFRVLVEARREKEEIVWASPIKVLLPTRWKRKRGKKKGPEPSHRYVSIDTKPAKEKRKGKHGSFID